MIVRFWYQIVSFFSVVTSLMFLFFSHIFYSFAQNCIVHQFKKVFFKIIFSFFLRSVFSSIHGFNHAFWLNLIILCTFCNSNPWFNACFKFLMCITYSVLSFKLATCFSTSLILLLKAKRVIQCVGYVKFWNIEHQFQENIHHHFHHYSFLWNLH